MDLADGLKRQLVDAVHTDLGTNPGVEGLRRLVGPEHVRRLPAGLSSYAQAQWVVRIALAEATPQTFVEVVGQADLAEELHELQALVKQLAAEPEMWSAPVVVGLWMPKPWPFIDRTSVLPFD